MTQKVRIYKMLFAVLAVFVLAMPVSADNVVVPMRQVRDMVRDANFLKVEDNLCIEGYVISKPHGHNNDLNIQVHYASLKNDDLATLYVESLSGDVGLRIKLSDRKYAKQFPRYSRVVLSLKGTTLRYAEPCCVTVYGLSDANIVQLTECDASEMPYKDKYISELTDDDIYTYVILKDCEMVFKDGAFSNVYEHYVLQTSFNKKIEPNKSMDGWATLVCDKNGSSIYALVNTLCRWRRDGQGVPQGSGDMRGIVTHVALPRYGGDVLGRYMLFPVDRADFSMDWYPETSAYKSIAEWHWNDNKESFLTESGRKNVVTTEKIKSDIGKGLLRVMAEGAVSRGKDTNNTYVAAPKENDPKGSMGFVDRGALSVKTEARNWWDWEKDCGKGVEIEFSTAGLSGERLLFGFTFAAGDLTAATSQGFPIFWNVEYSVDGVQWNRVEGEPKKLRTLPWRWFGEANGTVYDSILAGAGLTEHVVALPKSLFGHSKVYVRVVPVAKNAATLGYDYADNGALRHNSMVQTIVNFGTFVVRYN